MYVTAIVLAAGRGERLGVGISKPLARINTRPIIIYCLKAINKYPGAKEIIVVVNAQNKKQIVNKIKQYRIKRIKKVVLGGRRRQDSVLKGLEVINRKTDLVLIHDSARPFINKEIISRAVKGARKFGAAIAGVPVKATIKEVQGSQFRVHGKFFVKNTIDRSNLWEIQTPQVFRRDLILEAYKKFVNTEVTDDAALVEKLGHKVHLVTGSYFNIKITTPEDLALAEAILKVLSRKL